MVKRFWRFREVFFKCSVIEAYLKIAMRTLNLHF